MGRLESLTAWALGRTPYEDEVIRDGTQSTGGQQYNEHGHPRNPETKKRERESVRAANEVMQVTGVVEDALAARAKAVEDTNKKIEDTFAGLRLMEVGRAVLVGGVWGVLGLRRRILIYKPYAQTRLLEILRQEHMLKSAPSMLFSGIPAVVAYHISDYTGFIVQALMDGLFDEDEDEYTRRELWLKHTAQTFVEAGFYYVTLHFRLFAILQQLNLLPGSRLLPSFRSFVPFSAHSPLEFPSNNLSPTSWIMTLLGSASPMLIILVHGRLKAFISKLLYKPIYKALPRPTGDSMFSGLDISAPDMEYDAPDRTPNTPSRQGEDAPTLRALEGRPALEVREEREEERIRRLSISMEQREDSTEDEDDELHQTALISFDVQATDAAPSTGGSWSAELRSANDPKPSSGTTYRVTGLTLLPTILASEGIREIVAGVVVMPLEAIMVRIIAREYQRSSNSSLSNLYGLFEIKDLLQAWENLFGAFTFQVIFTGVVWAGFTFGTQWWAKRRESKTEEKQDTPLFTV